MHRMNLYEIIKAEIVINKTINYIFFYRCPAGRRWEKHFIHWYKDMGPYIHCYASIKQSWDKIITYFKVNCPVIYKTIKGDVPY